jgi:hypothetical protein
MAEKTTTLIRASEAIEILTWVSPESLRRGLGGTQSLTRCKSGKHWLYIKEECLALKNKIVAAGYARKEKQAFDRRNIPTELV